MTFNLKNQAWQAFHSQNQTFFVSHSCYTSVARVTLVSGTCVAKYTRSKTFTTFPLYDLKFKR